MDVDTVKLGGAVITALVGCLVFIAKKYDAVEKKRIAELKSELEVSKKRHDKCEIQHEETKEKLHEVEVSVASIEARIEERDTLAESIEKLSEVVIEAVDGQSK